MKLNFGMKSLMKRIWILKWPIANNSKILGRMEHMQKMLLEMRFEGKIVDEKSGNSGTVYIVEREENVSPRHIAFKTLKVKHSLDIQKKTAFLEECESWFRLRSHYIVTPFYGLVWEGMPYICMSYCDSDLKSLMLKETISETAALQMSVQITKALIALRKIGLHSHQDLNPPNILITDLSRKFPNYPTNDFLNIELRISDFGIANLLEKIGPTKGGGGGKFPFKAPEQYFPKYFDSYEPDVFAFGVIACMLLTGHHPNGMTIGKALNKSTSGKLFHEWALDRPQALLTESNVPSIINQCLEKQPTLRPSYEELYDVLLSRLKDKNQGIYENLILRFDYYDSLDNAYKEEAEIFTIKRISELPDRKQKSISDLIALVNHKREAINNSRDVVVYCETLKALIEIIDKGDVNRNLLISETKRMVDILAQHVHTLKVVDRYPPIEVRGTQVLGMPNISDYEVGSEYVSMAASLLSWLNGGSDAEAYFLKVPNKTIRSMYFYHQASIARGSDIFLTIDYLNRAKKLMPNEWLFYYMENLWIDAVIAVDGFFSRLSKKQRQALTAKSIDAAETSQRLKSAS
jgi:serine/threonine protein kinase